MSYSDLYRKETFKIPSILGVAIIAAISFLVSGFFLEQPRSTQAIKKNVLSLDATNVSSNKASVVWRTSEKEVGTVIFGKEEKALSQIALDERDTVKQTNEYFNHSVPLTNLTPHSRYYFSITNGKELFEFSNKSVFSFSTIQLDNRINSLKPAYGTIVSQAGIPERDVLVLLNSDKSVPLSTMSKGSGEWLIPLNGLISKSSRTLLTPATTENVTLTFFDEKGNKTTIQALIDLISPVADPVKMGRSYSLPEDSQVLSATTTTLTTPAPTSLFQLTYPVQNATIPIGNPLIKGRGTPQSTVTVTVVGNNQTVTRTAAVDIRGDWKITLSSNLKSGSYSLTAQVTKPKLSEKLVRSFVITKSGQQVLGEATGSAQLTSTPTPTSVKATPTTTDVEPTEITPTLPATGGTITYFIYSSAALILLGLGLLVVF